MLRMVSYSHRPKSGQITCYLNRTYHVLTTLARRWCDDESVSFANFAVLFASFAVYAVDFADRFLIAKAAKTSVAPGSQVGPRRRSLLDAVENLRQIHGVVVQARKIVGKIGIAIPAVLRAITVFYFPVVRRVFGGFQEILQVIDRVI